MRPILLLVFFLPIQYASADLADDYRERCVRATDAALACVEEARDITECNDVRRLAKYFCDKVEELARRDRSSLKRNRR